MAKEQIKENPALDAILSQPAAEAVAEVAAAPSEVTPVAGRVFHAKHGRDTDEVVETTDAGQMPKTVKRKYKSFRVLPIGANSAQVFGQHGVTVENCTDETEAKQVAYHKAGVQLPSKYPTKVVAA